MRRTTVFWSALALACAVGCTESCDVKPPPQPGPTGGVGPVPVETGGTAQGGQGGAAPVDAGVDAAAAYAKCVEDQSADPVQQNIARQSGVPLSQLVDKVCRDRAVLGGFAR